MQCHPQKCVPISIHALRVEGDGCRCLRLPGRGDFYPRPPGGGRPAQLESHKIVNDISIHALRVEGDRPYRFLAWLRRYFYPRPPGGGRRVASLLMDGVLDNFYPRPPGGGRLYPLDCQNADANFYPRPPGGGRLDANGNYAPIDVISIHALRVEGDSKNGQSFRLFLRKREKNLPL